MAKHCQSLPDRTSHQEALPASPERILHPCYLSAVTTTNALLRRLEADSDLADLLRWPGDFDLDRRDPVEELRLPRGLPLAPIAGCGSDASAVILTMSSGLCCMPPLRAKPPSWPTTSTRRSR